MWLLLVGGVVTFLLDCFGGGRFWGVTVALDELFFFLLLEKGDLNPSSVINFLKRSLSIVKDPGIVICCRIASASSAVRKGSSTFSSSDLLLDNSSALLFSIPGMCFITTSKVDIVNAHLVRRGSLFLLDFKNIMDFASTDRYTFEKLKRALKVLKPYSVATTLSSLL